jgi:hypothetical protein
MIRRCCNPWRKDFERYGGRGITVCEAWRHSFAAFLADMGPRPSPEYSIERRQNDGPYSPENCYWGTRKEQCRNRRSSTVLTLNGVGRTLAEWVELTGIHHSTISMRIRCGWSVEKALTTPADGSARLHPVVTDPTTQQAILAAYAVGESVSGLARRYGVNHAVLTKFFRRNHVHIRSPLEQRRLQKPNA